MQRAHRVDDRPAGAERAGGAAIRWFAVADRLAVALRLFGGMLHSRHRKRVSAAGGTMQQAGRARRTFQNDIWSRYVVRGRR